MSETASRNSTGAAVRCEALPPQGDPQSGRVSTLAFHWTRATSGDGKEAAQLNAPNHGSWLRRRPRESNFPIGNHGGDNCVTYHRSPCTAMSTRRSHPGRDRRAVRGR